MPQVLPIGRRGQALAIAILLLPFVSVWLGVIAPAIGWYQDRADHLRRQQATASHMAALVAHLPDLRTAVAGASKAETGPNAFLPGTTDALAAAALQQKLDTLARNAGITIASQEILPAQQAGDVRIVAVRLAVSAPWHAMTAFLLALAQSETPMIADEMQLRGLVPNLQGPDLPVEASISIIAYRTGEASAQ